MKVQLTEIPEEGLELDFELDKESINARLNPVDKGKGRATKGLVYIFTESPKVHAQLKLEGQTVFIGGHILATMKTNCCRCAEEAIANIRSDFDVVLKPYKESLKKDEQVEDLSLGFYDSKEVDCTKYAEEYLLLDIPNLVYCKPDCKGLCPNCGQNLNVETCKCPKGVESKIKDDRLSILSQIKIH